MVHVIGGAEGGTPADIFLVHPTHDHLGNYPQALTHAALVQAALALRDATPS